jgi:hypothetical protein
MAHGRGTRVYWNGIFPDLEMRGTVVEMGGTLRTEVRWDGSDHTSMENNSVLKKLPKNADKEA